MLLQSFRQQYYDLVLSINQDIYEILYLVKSFINYKTKNIDKGELLPYFFPIEFPR